MAIHASSPSGFPGCTPVRAVRLGRVKTGVGFGDPLGGGRESSPFLIGPTVEVRLPASFAIEASALYRRLGYTYSFHFTPEPGVSTLVGRVATLGVA